MEEQTNLETIGIGDKESIQLKPATVKIVKASVKEVGDKAAKKLDCEVKHPDKEENIHISSAKVEQKGQLKISGLWFNTDEDEKIRKGSALAAFLQSVGAGNVKELEGKEIATLEDDKGYLAFKGY